MQSLFIILVFIVIVIYCHNDELNKHNNNNQDGNIVSDAQDSVFSISEKLI